MNISRRRMLAHTLAAGTVAGAASQASIDAAFPGGNIVVERIEGDDVILHQDLRDTEGHWFYWAFRVRGAGGRTLRFRFTNGDVVGVRGPAVSEDAGRSWRWLGSGSGDSKSFFYSFPPGAPEVRFAVAMPYQESDLRRFLARHRGHQGLRVGTLTRSRKGREVELIRIGNQDADLRVFLTARHHCCESMASYVLEGMLEAVLADAWLARNIGVLAVPFVDKDGVEDGDQGKNRRPRDHNRDYDGVSVHPEIRAIREQVPLWGQGRIRVALDLHCPTLRGAYNEVVYFVGGQNQEIWAQVQQFAGILEKERKGPLIYRASDNLPFGKAWNTGSNYAAGMSNGRWTSQLPGIRMAASLEIAYANANGSEVNAASARLFGADLARALRIYLAHG